LANKQLTASVRLNTSQAENAIKRLNTKINNINKSLNKTNTTKLTRQISKAGTQATKLRTKLGQVNSSLNKTATTAKRVSTALNNAGSKVSNIRSKTQQWASAQRNVNTSLKSSNSLMGSIGSKLKHLAATYLGIMGAKAVVGTSDMITSAENKLNYVSAQQLGASGANSDGSYSQATFNATQQAMDKMYASSQKVRMGYGDMMTNVSKSMALAGDAFAGNTDNAIRFQEIMAEAYAVGGASAQEMSTSMYQMIQALGAGVLAGDELRSVREGAPLAYQAIEEFAQGVYNTEESLKDLASQGKITSDMVVAAVMNAGNKMDNAFAQTKQTFAQTWEQIKNAATYAFRPISTMLNDTLNNAIDSGLISKVEALFTGVSKVIQIVIKVIANAISWIADNWYWLQHVVVGALIAIGSYMLVTGAIAVASAIKTAIAWIAANWVLLLIVASIALIVYGFYLVTQGALTMTQFLVYCAVVIGAAFLIAGIIMGSIPMLIIAAILLLLAVIFMFFEEVCYGAAWLAAWIVNILSFIWNVVVWVIQAIASAVAWLIAMCVNIILFFVKLWVAEIMFIYTLIQWVVAGIVNLAMGIWNVISAVCQNIGIAFSNAWNGALSSFWNFIASCMEGLDWLAKPISAIAELFGKSFNYEGFTASLRAKADGYSAKQKDYVNVGDAWSSGWNTMKFDSMSDNVSAGWNVVDFVDANALAGNTWDFLGGLHTGYADANAWGSAAGNWGAGVKNSINDWGSQFKKGDSADKGSLLDNIGNSLGLDFSGMGKYPNVNDPSNSVADSYNMPSNDDLLKGVDGIKDNTGDIKDGLDLTNEDLDYLRRIADMEWKKEFTTAVINVEMNNNNNVNGEMDLKSIAISLRELVEDEMYAAANGVYA
jgi:tape measure domain-containing protein